MGTSQNRPRKTDKPVEHPSITQENAKTKRLFGCIILIGLIILMITLLSAVIVSIIWNIGIVEKLVKYFQNYGGVFSVGITIGIGIGNMSKAFRYFAND